MVWGFNRKMQFYWEGRKIHIVFTLYGLLALVTVGEIKGKLDDKDPSFLDHNIDKHVIFALPLSQGAYDFDVDGFIRKYLFKKAILFN